MSNLIGSINLSKLGAKIQFNVEQLDAQSQKLRLIAFNGATLAANDNQATLKQLSTFLADISSNFAVMTKDTEKSCSNIAAFSAQSIILEVVQVKYQEVNDLTNRKHYPKEIKNDIDKITKFVTFDLLQKRIKKYFDIKSNLFQFKSSISKLIQLMDTTKYIRVNMLIEAASLGASSKLFNSVSEDINELIEDMRKSLEILDSFEYIASDILVEQKKGLI